MNQSITAEKLTFENIQNLGKALETHSEEEFEEESKALDLLRLKFTSLDAILSPLKDDEFSEMKDKEIAEYSYQDIVRQYGELTKQAIRVYGPKQAESLLD